MIRAVPMNSKCLFGLFSACSLVGVLLFERDVSIITKWESHLDFFYQKHFFSLLANTDWQPVKCFMDGY